MLSATGREQLVSGLKEVTKELNEADKATERQQKRMEAAARWRKQAGVLAKAERTEAFQRLATEEKLVRLQAQRERIQLRIAQAQGNEYRTAALMVRLRQTEAGIRGLRTPGGGGAFMGGMMGAGALRGLLGPLSALTGITSLVSLLRSQFRESDSLADIGQQYGLQPGDVLRTQRAAGYAGVRQRTVNTGLSYVSQLRARALGGDREALSLFSYYGVSGDQLKSGATPLDLAMTVRRGLGDAGPQPKDAQAMRTMFGYQSEGMIATLTELGKMPKDATQQAEADIKTIDRAGTAVESWWNRMWDKMRSITAAATKSVEPIFQKFDEGRVAAGGTAFFNPAVGAPSAAAAPALFGARTAGAGAVPNVSRTRASDGATSIGSADALARVGLFVGGGNKIYGTMEEYKRYMAQMVIELRQINLEVSKEN